MRKFLIAGNWKMNKTAEETRLFFTQLKSLLTPAIRSELLICPPFTALQIAADINATCVALGAQNVYPKDAGAFTGEISPSMLKEFVSYVLVGHSERRILLHETNAFINEKIHALLKKNLKPILCIGESLQERQQDRAFTIICEELKQCLEGISHEQMMQLTIAYEPIWAIGTGETASPEIVESMHQFIRTWLSDHFNEKIANTVRLIYGGSLKESNAKQLFAQPHVDGGLIGGAALDPYSFIEIAKIADKIEK